MFCIRNTGHNILFSCPINPKIRNYNNQSLLFLMAGIAAIVGLSIIGRYLPKIL
jgi:hypothetical protein